MKPLKVKDIIKELQAYDPEAEIIFENKMEMDKDEQLEYAGISEGLTCIIMGFM